MALLVVQRYNWTTKVINFLSSIARLWFAIDGKIALVWPLMLYIAWGHTQHVYNSMLVET